MNAPRAGFQRNGTVEIREEQRETWGTRAGFVLAAIGSAVGLGNLWGFPYKLYSYGGGAFLIPYLVALIAVGVPMLILEFTLGHSTQRAAPDAFGRLHRRFEMVGWWGILLSFVIITYYPVILAYCFSYLWFSLKALATGANLPWAGEGLAGVTNAGDFFYKTYLGYSEDLALGGLRLNIAVPLALTWLAMYLCIFRGVRFVGKIVWLTVPLPWIMLLILAARGLTLPGSPQGLAFYLNPDWSQLAKPSTWRFAFGQMFFSLSLAFGVMITYASFLHRRSDLNNNAALVGLADTATSFVAGLAVFATLGGMAFATQQAGHPVPVQEVVKGGPGLAFVAFPYALAQLPYPALFSAVFFITLVTLGIDSAFSITESILAAIVDKTGWRRGPVLIVMSLVGLAFSLVYATAGGLNWLGIVDGFVNGTWGIAFMGLLQCLVLGWLYRIDRLRRHANERSDWRLGAWWNGLIRFLAPVTLGTLVWWSMFDDFASPSGFLRDAQGRWHAGNVAGLAVVTLAPLLALAFSSLRGAREAAPHPARPAAPFASGLPALVAAVASVAAAVCGFAAVLAACRGGRPGDPAALAALAAAALAGAVAAAAAYRHIRRAAASGADPAWSARWAGILGTVALGAACGFFLALRTSVAATAAAPSAPAEGLSAAAYGIIAAIGVLVFGGLAWSLYRAVTAGAREDAAGERI
ncbi:MAG: sodium-dependent transporter [Lentisphaerae bacterium]|nr:sodium-dependent transporter [Lentisphaerota bacterium]